MTKVYCEENNGRYLITATGHADGGRVCAGVSAIMQALDGWCANFAQEYKSNLQSGYASVNFTGPGADTAYSMAMIGLMQISMGYPGACHVEVARGENRK